MGVNPRRMIVTSLSSLKGADSSLFNSFRVVIISNFVPQVSPVAIHIIPLQGIWSIAVLESNAA